MQNIKVNVNELINFNMKILDIIADYNEEIVEQINVFKTNSIIPQNKLEDPKIEDGDDKLADGKTNSDKDSENSIEELNLSKDSINNLDTNS